MLQALCLRKTILIVCLISGASLLASCTTEMLSSNGNPMSSPSTHPAPPKVDPIVINGRQYGGGYNQGALPITDVASGKKIKNVKIYYYPDDKPAVFFKSMKLVNNDRDILIVNELGEKFLFNLKTEKVRRPKQ